ncbi:HAD-IA family hydrolase [Streptomyces sp. NPDC051018]|uniref:HAD-IA family hydrolase n=1 Tax=Streptomyces sp. NPDC051018 TaxID=3365639 RepID=UPI0037BB9FCA
MTTASGTPGPRGGGVRLRGTDREIRAVVFDTDGVLTDSARLHAAAWKDAFDAFLTEEGHGSQPPFDAVGEYLRHVDGKSRLDGARDFLRSRGLNPSEEQIRTVASVKDRAYLSRLGTEGAEVFPDAVRLLRRLRTRGVALGAASASRHAGDVLDRAGLRPLLDTVVDGNDTAHLPGKPDPALFLEAARRLGPGPGATAVAEDAVAGVEAWHRGGFALVVGVDRADLPDRRARLLHHGADLVVTGLDGLLREDEDP